MSEDWGFWGFLAALLVGVALFVGGFAWVGTRISKHYAEAACHSFSDQSNRKTKFVTYTYWSWDCLTPTADGKWISAHNLREFGEQP